MKNEHSAGGVILRKMKTTWQVFVIKDMSGNWTFPKGKIEQGETIEEAAKREIFEETGITNLVYKAPLPCVNYSYKRNGIVEKIVNYMLFLSVTPQKIVLQKEEGIKDYKWTTFENVVKILGYKKTFEPLLKNLERLIQTI